MKSSIKNKFRYSLYALLVAFVFSSCEGDGRSTDKDLDIGYRTVEIDGCEYLVKHTYQVGYLAHKGNCKYCIARKNNCN